MSNSILYKTFNIILYMYVIKASKIQGKGVHATEKIPENTVIDVGIYFLFMIYPMVTENFGAYLNHSYDPNSELRYDDEKWQWMVVSTKLIKPGEEITMNYNNTPWYIQGPQPDYK